MPISRLQHLPRINRPWAQTVATVLAILSFTLIVHNFAFQIFPGRKAVIPGAAIRPVAPGGTYAYEIALPGEEPDQNYSARSAVRLFENGVAYTTRTTNRDEVSGSGGLRYAHEPGRIIFATSDNTDPRSNGRVYEVEVPVAYGAAFGIAAVLAFSLSVFFLSRTCDRALPTPESENDDPSLPWALHLTAATLVLGLGIYCNTGSLAPYAITTGALVDPSTGYAYNPDHIHFHVLSDFLDGKDRGLWGNAIMSRRILFPVLAWPFTHVFGFEIGGEIASIAYNLLGFVIALSLWRKRLGTKGAVAAAWLLAFYPGAAYWGSLPYVYSSIFPLSLLLMTGLVVLETARGLTLIATSAGMGLAYLGYDLAPFFLPAAVAMFAYQRRWRDGLLSAGLQCLPLVAWIGLSTLHFHFPLTTSNSVTYSNVLRAYVDHPDFAAWMGAISKAPAIALDVFFGSNFIYLPVLFVAALGLGVARRTVRLSLPEVAVLLSAGCLFAFLNFAPPYGANWVMRGTWISRLYQPIFPVFVLFVARSWVWRPSNSRLISWTAPLLLAVGLLGNSLTIFGPILGDPLGVSTRAFYRFYDHNSSHGIYRSNLIGLGRHPLGFKNPRSPNLEAELALGHSASRDARDKAEFETLEETILTLRRALFSDQRAFRATAKALAQNLELLDREQFESSQASAASGVRLPYSPKPESSYLPPFYASLPSSSYLDAEPTFAKRPVPEDPGGLAEAIARDRSEQSLLIDQVRQIEKELIHAQEGISRSIHAIETLRAERSARPPSASSHH